MLLIKNSTQINRKISLINLDWNWMRNCWSQKSRDEKLFFWFAQKAKLKVLTLCKYWKCLRGNLEFELEIIAISCLQSYGLKLELLHVDSNKLGQ